MRRAIGLPALLLMACTSVEHDPASFAVAWIDDRPLSLEQWQRYRAANLLEMPGEPAADDRVSSRLFDAFVDERLLVVEAERRGLTASDREIEAWLSFAENLDDEVANRQRWEEGRRRVMIQKLEEEVGGTVSDHEPPELPVDESTRSTAGRIVRLSSLRFEDRDLADQIAADISRGRMTFDDALIAHGAAQDGVPVDLPWDGLWDNQRAALDGLRAGQVSRPVEIGGTTYLFRIDAWLEQAAAGAVQDARVRRGLERARRQAAFAALLEELKKKTAVRINVDVLPFTYVAEDAIS